MAYGQFKFCPYCADVLVTGNKNDSDRNHCRSCGWIHYRNPTVGVAVIFMEQDRILLVRRKGSYKGMWCIPCGHVEWNEDIRKAAAREFQEETGLVITIDRVFDAHSNFHDKNCRTAGIWFVANKAKGTLSPGSDAQDAEFFPIDNLPEPMAFPTDIMVCKKLAEETRSHLDPTMGYSIIDQYHVNTMNIFSPNR